MPLDYGDQDVMPADPSPPASGTAAWSLVTSVDPSGHMWTSFGPNTVVARRIATIAKASWATLAQSDSKDLEAKVSLRIQ